MRFVVTNLDVEKFGTNVSRNGEQFGTFSGVWKRSRGKGAMREKGGKMW